MVSCSYQFEQVGLLWPCNARSASHGAQLGSFAFTISVKARHLTKMQLLQGRRGCENDPRLTRCVFWFKNSLVIETPWDPFPDTRQPWHCGVSKAGLRLAVDKAGGSVWKHRSIVHLFLEVLATCFTLWTCLKAWSRGHSKAARHHGRKATQITDFTSQKTDLI